MNLFFANTVQKLLIKVNKQVIFTNTTLSKISAAKKSVLKRGEKPVIKNWTVVIFAMVLVMMKNACLAYMKTVLKKAKKTSNILLKVVTTVIFALLKV